MSEIVFDLEPREPLRDMPNCIIMMSKPGAGKSKITSDLTTNFAKGESLCFSLGEENGYDNFKVAEFKIEKYNQFEKILDKLAKEKPVKFAIFDNLSVIEEWIEIQGTINYMMSNQGKSFNYKPALNNSEIKGPGLNNKTYKSYFMPGDKEFNMLHHFLMEVGIDILELLQRIGLKNLEKLPNMLLY